MKKLHFDAYFEHMLELVKETRDAGQKEYAHTEENVFANFARIGESIDAKPDKVLMIYLLKHIDGINAYIKGHDSQREDVTGRIKDSIVYLFLLWAMADGEKALDAIANTTPNHYSQKSAIRNGVERVESML